MTAVSLEVNGRKVEALVEPRTHLADFLREQRQLTGTHLGCEHGVCGACTVLLDGKPVRSCITYAVACEGRSVRTIEGFGENDDPVMTRLRTAFSKHHALQCGFCTPGMLMTARDIVTRLAGADEARIRLELSGNLCRCTGYVGIVAAVHEVADEFAKAPLVAKAPAAVVASIAAPAPAATSKAPVDVTGGTEVTQSIAVAFPLAAVWALLVDLDRVAACLPGARLTAPVVDGAVTGEVAIKFGAISATMAGTATFTRDDAGHRASLAGSGRDRATGTRLDGQLDFAAAADGTGTRIEALLRFRLAGPLAQFGRPALVQDLAQRLAAEFAANLERSLSGAVPVRAASLDAGGLVWAMLKDRIRAWVERLFAR